MNNRPEKLSLLSELIGLMKADGYLHEREYDFLYIIADRMGIDTSDVLQLFDNKAPFTPPSRESERILQFHRLVLLMNSDDEHHPEEIRLIKEIGVKMGLSPFAIQRVLEVMGNYEDRIVPPDALIEIFKSTYN